MSKKTISPTQLPSAPAAMPETWITAAEAASILHLSLRTILNRASSGKLLARIPEDIPFTYDGKQNYLIHLESLPQKAQLEYLRNHLPSSQSCDLDLTTPRSTHGDRWLYQFLDVAGLIHDVAYIRNTYHHTGIVTARLRELAESRGISLSTLPFPAGCGNVLIRQAAGLAGSANPKGQRTDNHRFVRMNDKTRTVLHKKKGFRYCTELCRI